MMSMVFCYSVLVIHLNESRLGPLPDTKEEKSQDDDV